MHLSEVNFRTKNVILLYKYFLCLLFKLFGRKTVRQKQGQVPFHILLKHAVKEA